MAKKTPKDQKYRSMKAYIGVKSPERYKAQKLQHLIRQYEKMADKEPWRVDPKKYILLLNEYGEASKVVEKERKQARVEKGVDKGGVDSEVQSKGSSRVRKDKPFSLDA